MTLGVPLCRFVILRHTMPAHASRASHWDLMLAVDDDGPLWTWELCEEPAMATSQRAHRLPDHRREYLTYEGPISADRGHVKRWQAGLMEWHEQSESHLVALLHGTNWLARVTLDREADLRWLVQFANL